MMSTVSRFGTRYSLRSNARDTKSKTHELKAEILDHLERVYILIPYHATVLDAKYRRITNVGPPTGGSDAVNQTYVWDNTLYYRKPLNSYDSKKRRIINVAPPKEKDDAVNLEFLQAELQRLRAELAAKG
ncbi:Hypothetical protein NTJ_02455 [Nesidiocoris tenuis]|uniref:Uncharacterized protein n=1 Tax=Nesidiocoris tenuis TaxID=355587 RepID=A0ABN7AH28_9HEMI|nr:Hypothetical protein NTJ_02455 [Nesidiocoris tenuis]